MSPRPIMRLTTKFERSDLAQSEWDKTIITKALSHSVGMAIRLAINNAKTRKDNQMICSLPKIPRVISKVGLGQ